MIRLVKSSVVGGDWKDKYFVQSWSLGILYSESRFHVGREEAKGYNVTIDVRSQMRVSIVFGGVEAPRGLS